MSCPHLPAELLDHIVDFLHDSSDALKNCCLASRPWIPRTRKHLFASIQFQTFKDLVSWNAMFSDPSTSPACYAKALSIGCPYVVATARAGIGCWLSPFSHVVHFEMKIDGQDLWMAISLVPFHGFSPVLKSLCINSSAFSHPQIFNLIRSFPLLEDVSVRTMLRDSADSGDHGFNKRPTITKPSSSPVFTGSLELRLHVRMEPIVSSLLSLPGGLRFRRLCFAFSYEADVLSATALMEGCRSTLESLKFGSGDLNWSQSAHLNLSKTTKLKVVEFTLWLRPRLLSATLRTVTRDHKELERITLTVVSSRGLHNCEEIRRGRTDGETVFREWLELDRLLAQLNESHSVRLTVMYNTHVDSDGSGERSRMGFLLPEATARRMVDLVEQYRR